MTILTPPHIEPAPYDTGRGRRRMITAGWAVVTVAVLASAAYIGFAPMALLDGFDSTVGLIERMLPPQLDDPGRIGVLALETLLMAVLGTVLAAVASIPLAFLAARNTTPHPALYRIARAVITFCRAMPDLLFAVLFVRALGIGVLPGVLALALHSIGMLGKLFADAIEQTDVGPREAVRSTGGGYLREMINAVVPQVVPSWTANFVYRIDINLRTSVVLGFVGAGGIGFALQDALRGLVYPRALGIVCVILAIIAAMELVTIAVRRALLTPSANDTGRERLSRLVFSATIVGATLLGLITLRIDPRELITWIGPSLEVFTRLVPPDFTAVGWDLIDAVLQTLAIGVVATAVGAALSLPFGILAASNVSPHPTVYASARAVILVVRAVPELVLAVIVVAAIGLGPVAGACALAVGSIGFLGKLVADAVEEIDSGPLDAVRSVGGGWWKTVFAAVVPQVVPSVVGSTLYLLDVNIRTSTVLGVVGAGGVGFLLFEAVRTLNFEFAGAIVVIVFAVVYVIERVSGWIRSKVV